MILDRLHGLSGGDPADHRHHDGGGLLQGIGGDPLRKGSSLWPGGSGDRFDQALSQGVVPDVLGRLVLGPFFGREGQQLEGPGVPVGITLPETMGDLHKDIVRGRISCSAKNLSEILGMNPDLFSSLLDGLPSKLCDPTLDDVSKIAHDQNVRKFTEKIKTFDEKH